MKINKTSFTMAILLVACPALISFNIYWIKSNNNVQNTYSRVKDSVVEINADGGGGTGFLYGDRSHVATAFHTIDQVPLGSWEIEVKVRGKEIIRARTERYDKDRDLAILELERPLASIKPFKIASSDPEVGDRVLVIGNSLGYYPKSLTTGIISGLNRKLNIYTDFIQFDAVSVGGNSGGPLLDKKGNVIGVATNADGGFGFAVPAEHLKLLSKRPALEQKVQPVIVDFHAPPDTFSGNVLSPQFGHIAWYANFEIINGDAQAQFLSFLKTGSAPNSALQDIEVLIDDYQIGERYTLNEDGTLRVPVSWNLNRGSHTLKVRTRIVEGTSGTLTLTLDRASFVTDKIIGKNGEDITRETVLKAAGNNFFPLSISTQNIIPRNSGAGGPG